jgi:hypothetical protein
MWKKALIAIMALAAVGEFIFSLSGFVAPSMTLEQFKIQPSPDAFFLGYIISWFLLIVAAFAFLSVRQILSDNPNGRTIAMILGLWWIAIGLGIWFEFHRPENLLLDSLKGAIIILCVWMHGKKEA